MLRFLRYVGLGALIAYYFDPDNGHRRRALATRDAGVAERALRELEQEPAGVNSRQVVEALAREWCIHA